MYSVAPNHLCLDIETIAGDPCEAEAWARMAWSPSPTWKAETIGNRWLEVVEKKRQRLALLDTAPIVSVAFRSEFDCRILHWTDCSEPHVAVASCQQFEDEAAMLLAVRNVLDSVQNADGGGSTLCGHNIRHFDLAKLRHAMMRRGLRLPRCLVDRSWPVFDTMREFERYTLDDRRFVSLSDVLESFQIPNHKQAVDGSLVGDLWDSGEHQLLLTYAVADVVAEYNLFLRMVGETGQ